MPKLATALNFVIPTGAEPDFLHIAIGNATKLNRKSGVAQERDLQFSLTARKCRQTIN
jgi:hypothetical protein